MTQVIDAIEQALQEQDIDKVYEHYHQFFDNFNPETDLQEMADLATYSVSIGFYEEVRNRDLQREVKRKQQLHNAGKNNYRRNNGYQEKLPDWAKDSNAKEKQTPAPIESQSTQVSSDLAEQIAKLKTSNQREQQ